MRYRHVDRVAAPEGEEPTRVVPAEELSQILAMDALVGELEQARRMIKTTTRLKAVKVTKDGKAA